MITLKELEQLPSIKKRSCMCLICPNCGAHELQNCDEELTLNSLWNIKAYKVDDCSHCLKCKCWFDTKGNIVLDEE